MQNDPLGAGHQHVFKKYLCVLNSIATFFVAAAGLGICGCGALPKTATENTATTHTAGSSTASLSLSPASGTIPTGQAMAFSSPFGPFPVQWSVNGIAGGNSSVGIVDAKGTYIAPSVVPSDAVVLSASLADALDNPSALSASITIHVVNPAPVITQISPSAISLGSTQNQVTVTGNGFNPNSKVTVNDLVATTAFVDTTHLSVNLPSAVSSTAGVWKLIVSNGAPGGGASSALMTVLNPVPTLSQVSPNSVIAGSPDLTVTLVGSGFVSSSQILMNGQVLPSSYLNGNQMSVVLPSSSLVNGEYISVSVNNDGPGGGTSESLTFTVMNPLPRLEAVSAALAFAGTGPITVTLSGTGYVPQSSVLANGQVVSSNWNGNGTLSVTIPPELLSNAGKIHVGVTNSAPGGGSSSFQYLTVLENGQVSNTSNPQVANYLITIPDGAKVRVEFGEQDYALSTSTLASPAGGGQVRVLVAGMKPNSEYHMRAALQTADGSMARDIDHIFNSGSLPSPNITVTRTMLGTESPGIQLFNDAESTNSHVSTFATDRDGNVIWAYPASVKQDFLPAKLTEEGNFVAIDGGFREFNLAGETINEVTIEQINAAMTAAGYSVPINTTHHDLQKLPNGHYLFLANTYQSTILNGNASPTQVLGDVIIDLDAHLNVAWFWNSFDHLDVNRHPVNPIDWTHSNSIQYLPDGDLLLSMRHQSWILKLDYADGKGSGDIVWKLGWQGDFTLPGAPLEWFYLQHYANALSDDGTNMRLALFDNGDNRVLDMQGDECGMTGQIACYSRALILDLDEGAKTAVVEFESNLGLYSFWGGSAQVASNGNFLMGITVTAMGGRAVEITTGTPSEPVWQLDVFGQNVYRSLRIPSLYPGIQWP